MRGISVVLRVLFVVVFLSMVSELGAQSRSVELSGVVTDAQKGVVPGASVAVTNEATGVRQATETNETGLYRIQNLIPGSYRIEVSKTGLKTLVQTGFVMQVGQITRLDAVLEVGAVTEMIQVQGAAPTLQTESAEVGLTVTQQQMEDLPILDRNSISLFNLNASLNVKSTYPMQGNRSANLAMYLNGNAQELRLDAGGQDMAPISDIVSEFRILSNNFSPEFRGVSAFVMETKGGTNGFHGSAYFWLRHRSLMANPWGATTKLPFRRIEPGFTFGGPIKKNKAFFFGAFQRWTITSNNPQFYTFPSNLERQGDFSRTFDRNGNPIPIYDPFSSPRTPFAANRIPTERIDPVGKALMSYYPEPNLTTISPNFTGTRTVDTRQNQPYGRVDYNWNERHRTYKSALWMLVHNDVRYPWAPSIGVFDDDKVYQQWRTYTVGHIYTPSPTWVLTSTFSYLNRTWEGMSPGLGMGYAEKVGLKGTFDPTAFFPGVSVSGYSGIPGRSWAGSGEQIYNRTFSFSQRFANTRGKHMLKFGTEIQPSRANGQSDTPRGAGGLMSWAVSKTAGPWV